jgi:hypothetical protein
MRPRVPSSPGPLAPASAARAEPVKNEPAKRDSKSDVRTVQSARGGESEGADVEEPPTLESEPPPSEQATSPKSPAMIAGSVAPQTPKLPNAPPIPDRGCTGFPASWLDCAAR